MKTKTTTTSIQFGEFIPGTKLLRRFQGKDEIAPVYIPEPGLTLPEAADQAIAAADQVGVTKVLVLGILHTKLFGEWYVWSLPNPPPSG